MSSYQTEAKFKTKEWEVLSSNEIDTPPEVSYYVSYEYDTHYGTFTYYTRELTLESNNHTSYTLVVNDGLNVKLDKDDNVEDLKFEKDIFVHVIDKENKKVIYYNTVKREEKSFDELNDYDKYQLGLITREEFEDALSIKEKEINKIPTKTIEKFPFNF